MGATIEEITSKLADAATGDKTAESPTEVANKEVAATVADDKTDTSTKKGQSAQERIQELVQRAKDAEKVAQETFEKLSAKDAEVSKLIELVQDRDQDSRIVAKINELHQNPKYKDLVETLDKAITGKDVELAAVATGGTTPAVPGVQVGADKASSDLLTVRGEIEAARKEAATAIADQKSELLLQKSDVVIKELFSKLPETEYTADDRRVLQSALTDMIDWDAIENNPTNLERLVAEGVQKTVDWYGAPRGRVATEAAKATQTPAEAAKSVDISKLEVGKLVQESVNGKVVTRPAINDDDFSALLAEELRRSKAR